MLRNDEELLSDARSSSKPSTQENDSRSNKTLGISTILSPDGAFFSKDIPGILTQLNLQPATQTGEKETGDINVYGAGDTEYGKNLFESLSIDTKNFILDPAETSKAFFSKKIEGVEQIESLQSQQTEITKKQSALGIDAINATGAELTRLQTEISSLETEYRALEGKITALSKLNNEEFDRAVAFSSTKAGAVSTLPDNVNISKLSPDSSNNVHVSLYRHVSQYLDPASTASEYCNVFFNAIDSINMSMCVPFFRLNIIDRFAKKKGRFSKLSLAAFLKQTTDGAGDKIFYEAEPFTTNTSVKTAKKLRSGKVVSTEAFFAPQTLLPDPTEILSNPRRLDTSVPLMSLNSFSIGIETVGIALLSKKTADLSITLHDRSRLADISPLVSVGNFSSLYFEIEWGWAHPHGEARFDNPVACYLNSLRYREVFSPTSYNMTMADGGAMNINIRLIGGGSLDAVNGSILNGGFLTRAYASQILDKLIKSEIAAEEGVEAAAEEIRTITKVLIDKSRTANMVSSTFVKTLWSYVDGQDRSPEARADLIKNLQAILDQGDYYKNEEIFNKIRNNIPFVTSYPPSDNKFDKLRSKYSGQVEAKDFTSVASFLAILVGMPLASTGLYSEVQLHTFKFNDAAGAMAGRQISDAPIRVAEVFKHPDQAGSLAQNTSISNALSLLANYLNNPKQPLYEISKSALYSEIKTDASKKAEADPVASVDKSAQDNADTFEKPDDFTTPNIRYIIRSVPAKEYLDESKKTIADYVINPEKLIAQIIIYDANASPNYNKIIGAYSYGKLAGKDGKKIEPDFAKDVFKRTFPSIIYGATNSVLKSVSVSTDINNAIAQQNILDMGKDFYLGRSKSDSSTDVSEISLFPGAVSVSMIGLPIIERGQEVYLDLGTGTTLDALYYVTSVKHDFRPGEFTTNLTLTYKGQGSVMSLTTMLEKFNETLPEGQKSKVFEELKKRASSQSAAIDQQVDDARRQLDIEREQRLAESLTSTSNP